MANRHMQRCSALLISRERPTDTAMRYHLIPIRRAIIKQLMNNRCWRACGEGGNPLTLLGECNLLQPPWKTAWMFLKKPKSEFPCDPTIPILSIYPEKKTILWKDSWTPVFTAAQPTIPKAWEQSKCPSTDEWIKKTLYTHTHTHNGILLRHLKKEIMPFAATWMDLEINILSEVRQKEKDNYHVLSPTCGI